MTPSPAHACSVRPFRPADRAECLRLMVALWPDGAETAAADLDACLARQDAVMLVAERTGDQPGLSTSLCGFAEVGERPFADGCDSGPVAFLEGWYVDEDVRGQGVGSALIKAAELWARARRLREFASDALLDNTVAHRAHEAVGFREVERAVRFRKPL